MMNYEIFKEVVKEKFMDYMPDSFKGMELIVRPAEKVNMTYDAINIRGEDTTISPTIYINDMYEKYQSCGDLEETLMAACDLMAMEFAKTPQVVDVDSLYKDADEKVVFQLINTEQNKSFLEQVPHREFQDLSIIYKLVVNADTESIQSIKVTNSLAERLGMNTYLFLSGSDGGEDEFVPEGAVKVSHRHRSCGIMCLCEIKEFRKSVFERGWNMNYE